MCSSNKFDIVLGPSAMVRQRSVSYPGHGMKIGKKDNAAGD